MKMTHIETGVGVFVIPFIEFIEYGLKNPSPGSLTINGKATNFAFRGFRVEASLDPDEHGYYLYREGMPGFRRRDTYFQPDHLLILFPDDVIRVASFNEVLQECSFLPAEEPLPIKRVTLPTEGPMRDCRVHLFCKMCKVFSVYKVQAPGIADALSTASKEKHVHRCDGNDDGLHGICEIVGASFQPTKASNDRTD